LSFALALHGGAGALPRARVPAERIDEMRRDLALALERGTELLARGGSALDAVVAATVVLEDSRVFNAARGAVLRSDGSARLDASLMNGADRRAGAVCLVRAAKNPIRLARHVLEQGRELLLAGEDADRLARESGLELAGHDYFVTDYRREQLERLHARAAIALDHDVPAGAASSAEEGQTVGVVALDTYGHLAAATSTGGMTNARPGRVGDSPIIGAGTWACDTTVAVSATGTGELFIRAAFAHEVHARLCWGASDLARATGDALALVVALGGRGGCVAIDRSGRVVTPFTTDAMPRAFCTASGERHVYVLEPLGAQPGHG
jgi:L-asparaginase / beta-aspartyl-peptidase